MFIAARIFNGETTLASIGARKRTNKLPETIALARFDATILDRYDATVSGSVRDLARRFSFISPNARYVRTVGFQMPFIDISQIPPQEVVPGCRLRTPYGENLMLSYLEMDAGAEIPLHNHPHEQGGILLKGRLELTIGDESRICEEGAMFLIPPDTPHRAVAIDGPVVVMDVFSPIREDYAELFNKYIPVPEADRD